MPCFATAAAALMAMTTLPASPAVFMRKLWKRQQETLAKRDELVYNPSMNRRQEK